MSDKNGAVFVHKETISNALLSLAQQAGKISPMLTDGEYTAGYLDGVRNTLEAVAVAVGIEREKKE